MKIHFIYPAEPFSNLANVDSDYLSEYSQAIDLGFGVSLIDLEALDEGRLRLTKKNLIKENVFLVYRGWMLSPEKYKIMEDLIIESGFNLLTTTQSYLNSHYISNWYENCKELTIPTFFAKDINDLEKLMIEKNKNEVFIKDQVKSLTTTRGSIAKNINEAKEIVDLIKQGRGIFDGDITVRDVVNLKNETERRFFIFNNIIISNSEEDIPEIVYRVKDKHNEPFYTIDIVMNEKNEWILVEIGDGQVSDLKENKISNLYELFENGINNKKIVNRSVF